MYKLDTNEARKADNAGAFISEIGKYIGKFTQAEDIKATTGTRGIALNFESDAGQKARLSLYTEKANGDRIMGYHTLMAIMACLQLRGIEPRPGPVKHWNPDTRAEETENGTLYPDLQNKPIGLLLETEDYLRKDGKSSTRMVIKGVFQASTELTASEILDRKTKPEQLARMVASLRHRPLKGNPATLAAHAQSGAGSGFDDMDDDIPF
ncbi:MAG: hypothetical protein LBI48_01990 [Burkholderiaceae bacterium]|jgi:hypothetical protein|nr:hypothetical protein [Burkholderiaceae bacterium]